MKRRDELVDLSRDHHGALVIARRATRAAEGDEGAVAEAWVSVCAAFVAELEPHFVVEEQSLLPRLAEAGEGERVARTLADHARLRELAREDATAGATTAGATREALAEFGTLLRQHVLFEEKELFPCAEERLSPAELAPVAEASARLETALERVRRRPG